MPQAVHCREQLLPIGLIFAKFTRPPICLVRRLGYEALFCDQRQAPGQLQLDLSPVPSRTFGQFRQHRETTLEMADGFEVRQALGGMLAGLEPLIDGVLVVSGSGQMVSQELGLAFDEIGKMLLQRCCDAGVQFLPPSSQQCTVGGVLYEGVLEEIVGLRCDTRQKSNPASVRRSSPSRSSGMGRCAACSTRS